MEYEKYDQLLAQNSSENKKEVQKDLVFSDNLFNAEDETKGWY